LAWDTVPWICGLVAEIALIVVLSRICVYRKLPAFFVFVCWSFFCDALVFGLQSWYPSVFSQYSQVYFRIYEIQLVIDSAVIFAVLVELTWSVLRPVRSSLPRRSWIAIAVLIALAGLLLWPLAGLTVPPNLTPEGRNFFRIQQTFAILRVVVFLAMAGLSQLLSIGWRNRELQVATGLGFYSIVSLAITVVHTHQIVGTQYHWIDQVGVFSYLGTLSFWVLAFATKEAERQKFSPQMENFLLLVGGTAKASRVALNDFMVTKTRNKDDR
jgi:hypothetical protein